MTAFRAFRTGLFLTLMSGFAAPLQASELRDFATAIIDSRTFSMSGVEVRLYGIVSPGNGEEGAAAAQRELFRIVGNQLVTCRLTQKISARRHFGICSRNGIDVARELVASGYARDCERESQGQYGDAERRALMLGRGVVREIPLPPRCRWAN